MSNNDRTEFSEESHLHRICAVCRQPIRHARNGVEICGCLTFNSQGVERLAPMPDLDIERLRAEHTADEVARIVREDMGMPDLCAEEGAHRGPMTVISRHESQAPHVQCSQCGAVNRDGSWFHQLNAEGMI